MSSKMRASVQLLILIGLVLVVAQGCGECMEYRVKSVAEGTIVQVDSPDSRSNIHMESLGSGFDARALDASPVENRIAAICLALEEPFLDSDIRVKLDFSLALGEIQIGEQIPNFVCTNGVIQDFDPEHPTGVSGSVDVDGTEVTIQRIEAVSTSLAPPRFDMVLTGVSEDGTDYSMDLELRLEEVGNAPFCG